MPALFSVHDKQGKKLGHISADSDSEALALAKKRNKDAASVKGFAHNPAPPVAGKKLVAPDGGEEEKKQSDGEGEKA